MTVTDDLPTPSAPAGGSILDDLRRQREAIAAEQTVEMEVPNNGGLVWATYSLLPWRQINQLVQQSGQSKDAEAPLKGAAVLIAEACEEVFLRDASTGERIPWPGVPDGAIVRFDQTLAGLLGIDLPAGAKPSDLVRLAFVRDGAVTAMFNELTTWMRGAHGSVNRDFAEG